MANCAASGSGLWGSVSVVSSALASIRMCALRPLPITTLHGVGDVCVCVKQWHNDEGLADHLQDASSD